MTKPTTNALLLAALALLAPAAPALATATWQGGAATPSEDAASPAQETTADLAEASSRWALAVRTGVLDREALDELDLLRARVRRALEARPDDAALALLLTQVEVTRVDSLATIGDEAAARLAIEALRAASGGEGPAARARLAALENETVITVAERLSVSTALPKAQDLPASAALDRAVREAVAGGNRAFVQQLGARAVPTLAVLSRALDGSPRGATPVDPLQMLTVMDPHQGLEVMAALVADGDILLKRQVARTLASANVSQIRGLWNKPVDAGATPAIDGFEELLLKLLEEPGIEPTVLGDVLDQLVYLGWMPESLVPAAVEALGRRGGSQYSFNGAYTGLRPLAARALDSGAGQLLNQAVSYFLNQVDARPLAPLLASKNPDIAASAARMLQPRTVRIPEAGVPYQNWRREQLMPTFDATFKQDLRVAWASSNERIGAQVLGNAEPRLVEDGEDRLPRALLEDLASSARGHGQRESLARYVSLLPPDEELALVLMMIEAIPGDELLPDADARIEAAKVVMVNSVPRLSSAALWPVVRRAEELGLVRPELVPEIANRGRQLIYRDETNLEPYLAWAQARPEDKAKEMLVEQRWGPRSQLRDFMRKASPAARMTIARIAAVHAPRVVPSFELKGLSRQQFVDLIGDESLPVEGRGAFISAAINATTELSERPSEGATGAGRAVLSALAAGAETRVNAYFVETLGTPRDEFLGLAYSGEVLPKELAARRVSPGIWGGADDPGRFESLLKIFPPESWSEFPRRGSHSVASYLLHQLIYSERPDRVELAARLLRHRSTDANTATYWISRRSNPDDLPILEVILEVEEQSQDFRLAVSAVVDHMSDDAGALLLRMSKRSWSDPNRRTALMEGLQTILDWKTAAAAWEASSSASAKRETAIERLIAMTEDAARPVEARAEALRGLGLLGAAEELPRLIEALASPEEAIRAAARDAIDRLNADG